LETQPAAWLQPLKPESQPLQPVPPDEPHAALVGFDANIAAPAEANKDEFFTLPELQEEMKKLLWTKGEFRVVPYGFLWGTLAGETQRSVTGDYTLYVLPPGPTYEPAFHVDAKSTRIGVDVSGPRIACLNWAPSGGKLEFDFQGRFADTENRGSVLLRHAYWEVKNDQFRLLAGQTWDVISPLMPGVLSYSVGWGGGNMGYRRAQFRAERYLAWSDTLLLTMQGSLNVDLANDYAGNPLNVGDHSGWPMLEARVATTIGPRGPGCRPIELGVSGHIGEVMYDFFNYSFAGPIPTPVLVLANVPERTWSFNVDVRIPLGQRWGVQGEFFTGENLSTFLGGILQGIDVRRAPLTQAFISQNTIRSTGGWVDVWYDIRTDLHTHFGYSIDDPLDTDMNSGRVYNHFWFANLVYDVTPKFIVGLELTQWRTLWIGKPPADSTRLELVAKYGF